MQGVLDELEHQVIKLRTDIQHHKKRAAKSMQAAFTLGRASHVLGKFIMDDALFPPERKDAVYDEGDVTNLGTYAGPLFFSPHDSLYSSFLLYLFELPHLSTPVSQTHAY